MGQRERPALYKADAGWRNRYSNKDRGPLAKEAHRRWVREYRLTRVRASDYEERPVTDPRPQTIQITYRDVIHATTVPDLALAMIAAIRDDAVRN